MNETVEHAFDLVDLFIKDHVFGVGEIPQIVSQQELVFGFAGRSGCDGPSTDILSRWELIAYR